MPNLDERVSLVEGRVQEHAAHMTDLRQVNAEMREELRGLREDMRVETRSLREDMRSLREEMRADMGSLRAEMQSLRDETRQELRDLRAAMDRRFAWLVGIMVTGFVAMIGTVAGAFWSLLQIVQSRTL